MTAEEKALQVVEAESYSNETYTRVGFVKAIAGAIRAAEQEEARRIDQALRRILDDDSWVLCCDDSRFSFLKMEEHEDGGAMWRNGRVWGQAVPLVEAIENMQAIQKEQT